MFSSTTVSALSYCPLTLVHLLTRAAEGTTEYTTCAGLLTTSSSTWPKTALFQIAASGVPLSKLVIGKPANTADASNGYISTSTLASCVSQAKNQGWSVYPVLYSRKWACLLTNTFLQMAVLWSGSSPTPRPPGSRPSAHRPGPSKRWPCHATRRPRNQSSQNQTHYHFPSFRSSG